LSCPSLSSAFDNYFLAAQSLRDQLKSEMDRVFARANPLRASNIEVGNNKEGLRQDGVDILLFPSAISPAPTFEEAQKASKGINTYVQDVLTVPASLAGLPAASCPISVPDAHEKMPVGVQVVGQWGDDELVLAVAGMLEG
jgi:aspartyl-tRNA(Asn)/glutamyl-tRNA(Gln) amidotransferase subunit A